MPFLPSLHKSNPEPKPDHTPPPPPPLDSPWIISIIEKINQARQDEDSSHWETQSIYRVPKCLRDVDHTAYTPKIVSIGPYHHGCSHFQTMNGHKWRSLHHVLYRTGHDVRLYLEAARSLEDRARSCYEAPISMSSDAFVESLVLDSIFTLELFLGFRDGFKNRGYTPNDPVFTDNGIMPVLLRDMIMLENQLPLFVLNRILALQEGCEPSGSYLVATLALDFFKNLMPTEKLDYEADSNSGALHCLDVFRRSLLPRASLRSQQSARPVADEQHLHCLDVFRRSLLPRPSLCSQQSARPVGNEKHLHCLDVFRRSLLPRPSLCSQQSARPVGDEKHLHCLDVFRRSLLPRPSSRSQQSARSGADEQDQQLIHCVADLRNAGVKFQRRTGKDVIFWDIEFKDGVLYIPRLFIQDGTKSLFLNLIAFEQCHLKYDNYITSYISFMDELINSEVDVGYLHNKEIIEHWLGSDKEVVDMFNLLCQEVVFDSDDCYLLELSKQVKLYYNDKWNTWRASFNHKYFSNPWTFISLITAVVLLLLTTLQTFYTVYTYYKPK